MALAAGTRLGPYEILAPIGAGGMGEVYRAKDTKLGREVALKTLPPEVAGDSERLARFQREAHLLASLNHPHIAAIHGLEEADGQPFLVLELVEGEDLAERVKQGPIPVDEALAIARQIAEGLEEAHEKGIVHRDLKPANVKLTPNGRVKVLDFGLAKAWAGDPVSGASSDLSRSPTLAQSGTQAGVLLGTAAYMSPEQARGKPVDKRADIWAFGVVLYEMLTGHRPFQGEDVAATLADVIRGEPRWTDLPAGLSPTLHAFLKRCLEKNPLDRVRDIGDVRMALQGAFETPRPGTGEQAAAPPPWRRALPVVAATLLTGLVVGLATWALRPAREPGAVDRFDFHLPQDQVFTRIARTVLAVAPDGRSFVYSTNRGLYLRRMDDLEAQLLLATDGDSSSPFFSPDGQSVGFYASGTGELKRLAIGGSPAVVAKAAPPRRASWGRDGQILFGQPAGIQRVSAGGGTPEVLIQAEAGERLFAPQLLPDGDSLLFTVHNIGRADQQVVVQSLSDGRRTALLDGARDARYLPTGHLVFVSGDGLMGVAFDASRLAVTSGPVPLERRLMPIAVWGGASFGVSDEGTLVYATESGAPEAPRTLVWVDREGRETPTSAPPRPYETVSVSPDGTRAVVQLRDEVGNEDVWVSDLARGTLTRVTTDASHEAHSIWSVDGRRVVFESVHEEGLEVLWKAADGSGPAERLLAMSMTSSPGLIPSSWSPDGTTLFVHSRLTDTGWDVGRVAVDGPPTWEPLLQSAANETEAALSPDGRWLAYTSDETGADEVYVERFPELDGRTLISVHGGYLPTWSAEDELVYLQTPAGARPRATQRSAAAPESVVRVPLTIEDGDPPTLRPGTPERLFDHHYHASRGYPHRTYDVSPDGQRFLMIKAVDGGAAAPLPPRIVIVQNWFEELKRLVPAD